MFVFCVIVIAMAITMVSAKGMWGSRRKKAAEDAESAATADIDLTGMVSEGIKTRRKITPTVDKGESVEATLNMYLDMMVQLLESDEIDQYISPEAIQSMLSMIPAEALDSPEVAAMLNSPELTNPALLKMTIREGINGLRLYTAQIAQVIDGGPEAIDEFLSQAAPGLPEETKQLFLGLMSGDTSQLAAYLESTPGLDESQKAAINALLNGDASGMQSMFQNQLSKALGDTEQLEETRKQFLAAPEAAYAMGITEEQLNDPKLWAELMQDGMKTIEGLLEGDAEGDVDDESIRKFAASGAA